MTESSNKKRPTRGNGLFELCLAKKRIEKANSLIPKKLREGSVLDIGCGSYPYFLLSSGFKNKYGLEKKINPACFNEGFINIQSLNNEKCRPDNLYLKEYDIASRKPLPFTDIRFDAITLLAVVEHISALAAEELFKNIYKKLKPGGAVIITTPTKAADIILRIMAKINLVSKIEIKEHIQKYTPKILKTQLMSAGFKEKDIIIGRFECGLNLFAKAVK